MPRLKTEDLKRSKSAKLALAQGYQQGPYGPMGAGLNIGTPLDYSRPMLDNADGSFSTERTITLPMNGQWYNVPTVVNGQAFPAAEIEQYFNMGLLPHVGAFPTLPQAERSAIVRSQFIGSQRGSKSSNRK